MGRLINLTGKKFGRLTVVARGENQNKHVRWWCMCDCQLSLPEECRDLILVRGDSLKNGHTKSCGCYHVECARNVGESSKRVNTYDLSGEYGIGYDSNGNEFYFDLDDYEKIKDICWRVDVGKSGYVLGRDRGSDYYIRFHRVVLGLKEDDPMVPDHIHGKQTRNDNRKRNLRVATRSQNQMNMATRIDNTSGVTGVNWNKRTNKWVARIHVKGKSVHLGYFHCFDDAVKARKDAENKYYGEWAYDNSQKM